MGCRFIERFVGRPGSTIQIWNCRVTVVWCSEDIAHTLKPHDNNFFSERKLITFWSNPSSFTLLLEDSDWSEKFKHGANMLPGMVEWFNNYLLTKSTALSQINKIRFSETTTGNLQIQIWGLYLPIPDTSTVHWNFTDSHDNQYKFYGMDVTKKNNSHIVLSNQLSAQIIYKDPFTVEKITRDICSSWRTIQLPFHKVSHSWELVRFLETKKGYILTLVLDMINMIYQRKFGTGLVIWYENIVWDENIRVESLLDWSSHLIIREVGQAKPIKEWLWRKCEFEVIDRNNEKLVTWGAILYILD
jgi:hypothetical protein